MSGITSENLQDTASQAPRPRIFSWHFAELENEDIQTNENVNCLTVNSWDDFAIYPI